MATIPTATGYDSITTDNPNCPNTRLSPPQSRSSTKSNTSPRKLSVKVSSPPVSHPTHCKLSSSYTTIVQGRRNKKCKRKQCTAKRNAQFDPLIHEVRLLQDCEKIKKGRKIQFLIHEHLSPARFTVDLCIFAIGQTFQTECVVPEIMSEIYWVWSAAPRWNAPDLLGEWLLDSTRVLFFAERIESAHIDYHKFMIFARSYMKHMLNRFARTIQFAFVYYSWKKRKTMRQNKWSHNRNCKSKLGEVYLAHERRGRYHFLPTYEDIAGMRGLLMAQIDRDNFKHDETTQHNHGGVDVDTDTYSQGSADSFGDVSPIPSPTWSVKSTSELNDASTKQITRSITSKRVHIIRSQKDVRKSQVRKIQVVDAYFPR